MSSVKNRSTWLLIGMVCLIVILRWYIIYLFPVSTMDGTWSNSLAFSFINNQDGFNTFYQLHASRFYGFWGVPFFYFFESEYAIFILHELVKLVLCITVFKILFRKEKKWAITLFIVVLFFLDKELINMREELLLGTLILLFHSYYLRLGNKYTVPAILFFIPLYLLHPIAGLFHVLIYLSLHIHRGREFYTLLNTRTVLLSLMVLGFCIFYTFQTSYGQMQLYEAGFRVNKSFELGSFAFFLKLSFPLVLGLLLYRSRFTQFRRYTVWLLVMFTIIGLIGGHYYFVYAFIFTVLSVINQDVKPKAIKRNYTPYLGALVAVSGFLSIFHFFYVYHESPTYTQTAKDIIYELKHLDESDSTAKVYIDNRFAMPLLDKPNTRMMLNGMPFFLWSKDSIKMGDVLLVTEELELEKLMGSEYGQRLSCTPVVTPTIGVYSLSSLYKVRVHRYGLWRCDVVN